MKTRKTTRQIFSILLVLALIINIIPMCAFAADLSEEPSLSTATGEVGSVLDEITYLYGNESWGDLLTSYDGNTITYDTIGNPLSDGTWTYTWEQGRQLTKMQSSSVTWNYTYNSDGMRIGRTNGTDTYTYWYDGNGRLLRMKYNDIVMSFSYSASGQPMSITYNGAVYYYLVNAQGDVMGLIDSSGNLVVNYLYDAWGRVIGTAGSMSTTLGRNNPLRYRGYVYDTETGLYYLQNRYFNPMVGRFINSDVFATTGQGLLGNNMFAYCCNNPVSRSDSFGCFWDIVFDVASLVNSIIEVVNNPGDIGAWAGLVCDVVDVAIPCVGGLGEVVRAADAVFDTVDAVDDVHDAAKVVGNVSKSARTSAVRKAWKNEVELITTTGKGTRNWTDVELEELLTTGKVKGYFGHHMKSVKGYPELAGDPLNIQFLTQKEHLAAHGGNWRNITHGRYEL